MNTTRFNVVVTMMLIGALLLLLISSVDADGDAYNPDVDPDKFYLFNTTTRRYEDVIQWGIEADNVWIKMRVEDGIARYEFEDKEWARLYLNDDLKVTSTYNISEQDSKSGVWKTKTISPVNWIYIDHGETLELCREMKGSEESLNESWVFSFKLGSPLKITFDVEELKTVKANRKFDWILHFSTGYVNETSISSSSNFTKTKINNVVVDWSDFGKSDVNVSSNNSTSEYCIHFHPDGSQGSFIIDPSVGFTIYGPTAAWSWLTLSVVNTNNPDTTEVLDWNIYNWEFIDGDTPATYSMGCNPFPVEASIAAGQVRFYDAWGRSWTSAYFGTGASGSYVNVEIEIPTCWISVRTSDMIRDHGAFHKWTIEPVPPNTPVVEIDESIKFPVVVDASNQVNWEINVPEDVWIINGGSQTVSHADLVNRREYVLYFNVSLKRQPTSVHIKLYDDTTGKGIPFELFKAEWDDVALSSDIVQAWTDESHKLEILDFYGNVLYVHQQNTDESPIMVWEVDIPVCWLSIQFSDGRFHEWKIRESGGGGYYWVDEFGGFPIPKNPGSNWEIIVPEDIWISQITRTLSTTELADCSIYVLELNVSRKWELTSVRIRYYDNTTGDGLPFYLFNATWDENRIWDDMIQAWNNSDHTLVVLDFFGNEIYNQTRTINQTPNYPWDVGIPVFSLKIHNQDPDYVHKIGILWQGAGTPHEFYIAPYETEEKWLYNGSYEVRWTPYHWYTAQTTQAFTLVVTEANYFLVNGTTISRIVTDVAGVYALQEVITNFVTPGVLWDIECPPLVPTSVESDMDTVWVHPYSITRATVKQVIPNATSGTLWLPHPNRVGRNYNIIEDLLYIGGPYSTRIIINYTGNGTERFNYSYNPGFIDFGNIEGNYTVWSNNSCTFTRTTVWKEFDLFYWLYRPSERRYQVTLWVNNTYNRTWSDVRWFVGFAESSTIDIDGIKIVDNDNGVTLVRGENYDVSVGGISMMFTMINASQKRSFSFTCWDANASETLSAPMILLIDEDRKEYESRGYYHCSGSWTNSYAEIYSGPLYVSIKVKGIISPDSVIVVDSGASCRLSGDSYSVAGNTVIIIVSGVEPGDAVSLDIYYDKQQDEGRFDLFSPLIGKYGSIFLIIVIVSVIALVFLSFKIKGSERRQSYTMASLTYVLALLFVGMLHLQGVI